GLAHLSRAARRRRQAARGRERVPARDELPPAEATPMILIAGATGAVGSALVPHLRAAGFKVLPHVRPKTASNHPLGKDPDAQIFDLGEAAKLDEALRRCDAIVCLAGTMRKRFAQGDTYESSDYRPV